MDLSSLPVSYIDIIILIVVALYVMEGLERGFWILVGDLISFLGALAIALRGYPVVAGLIINHLPIPISFAKALGFILVALFAQHLLSLLLGRVIALIPQSWRENTWSRAASVVPAVVDSSILIAAFLTLLIVIPISPAVKEEVVESRIGWYLIRQTAGFEKTVTEVFGGAFNDSLTFLTIKPGTNERIDIDYRPKKLIVDDESEAKMLELLNKEREKVGAGPVALDLELIEVARSHSKDMWDRGYFAHTNPDGEDASDRILEAEIAFTTAGENLALAPTVDLAHQGLMNSPGHRANILDEDFARVGIGVIDGGIYGKMFTQNFAD